MILLTKLISDHHQVRRKGLGYSLVLKFDTQSTN